MPFLSYSEQTGLIVKSKADILEDLKSICKTAYGNNFVVVEGTEMYTFLDTLASALAENGAASKAVYDAFSFMGASGAPLDVLCSLAGIVRKEGESDNALRARYYKFLYTTSVGTEQGLSAQLLKQTITKTSEQSGITSYEVVALVDEVSITNNDQATPVNFVGTGDLPGHSIAVVCRKGDAFFEKTSDTVALQDVTYYVKYNQLHYIKAIKSPGDTLTDNVYYVENDNIDDLCKQLSNIVLEYKSLGCGVLKDTSAQVNYAYFQANEYDIDIQLTITFASNVTSESEQTAVKDRITHNVIDYINSLAISESVLYSGIMGCVYNAYTQLGYTSYAFECSVIKYKQPSDLTYNNTLAAGGSINVIKSKFAVCSSVTYA